MKRYQLFNDETGECVAESDVLSDLKESALRECGDDDVREDDLFILETLFHVVSDIEFVKFGTEG
jgi:hypothetical protein